MALPENLRYAETHEWVKVDGSTATVGITAYAVEQLSDLVFIELCKPGTTLRREQPFGEIESTKTVSELYAPVGGTVVEVNSSLSDDLAPVKESPFDAGWMVRIEMADAGELEQLLDAAGYEKRLADESHD